MKVTEHLARAAGKTLFSFEVLPPRKGETIQSLFANIEPLLEFKPPFIDVTYHREEYVFRQRPGGLLDKKTVRKRPGTVGICAAIKNKFDVDTVPHLICGGFSKEETENALIDLHFLGIDNVLALRGDPSRPSPTSRPTPRATAMPATSSARLPLSTKAITTTTTRSSSPTAWRPGPLTSASAPPATRRSTSKRPTWVPT
jgi:methylenetetrahydrofolate reductase (NADPH)